MVSFDDVSTVALVHLQEYNRQHSPPITHLIYSPHRWEYLRRLKLTDIVNGITRELPKGIFPVSQDQLGKVEEEIKSIPLELLTAQRYWDLRDRGDMGRAALYSDNVVPSRPS